RSSMKGHLMKPLTILVIAIAIAASVLTALLYTVAAADDVPLPAGYRNWFHVNTMIVGKDSPLFDALAGMHNVHVNSTGEAALKKGGPYPDGTVFVTDLHDVTVSDGSYAEGPLIGVAVMAKDAKKYASTGGWGFQFFAGADPQKKIVTDATK